MSYCINSVSTIESTHLRSVRIRRHFSLHVRRVPGEHGVVAALLAASTQNAHERVSERRVVVGVEERVDE